MPGPPLLSAGVIARRGGERVALREIDGLVLRGEGPPRDRVRFGDPFRVASISKMVTAAGFLEFAAGRAIDLDSDISALLGERLRAPAFPEVAITPRMLLCHLSGLRNGADFPVPFGEELLPRLSAAAHEPGYGGWFASEPEPVGAWFSYSDVNFGVLAQIMERISGRRFDLIMRDALFAPLGLEIGYNWSGVSQSRRNRAAAGARWREGRWIAEVDARPPPAPALALYRGASHSALPESRYRPGDNGLACAPHGGLRLSLADMDRLARLFAFGGVRRGRRILAAETLARMTTPAWRYTPDAPNGATENGFYQSFGLGTHAPGGATGDAFFGAASADWRGHFGDAYGWMTGLFWNTRTKDTIVYALNGMPETDRPRALRSALTAPEEALIDLALDAL